MTDRLAGKRAVITAAAHGIGRASAIAFARGGRPGRRHRHRRGGLATLAKEHAADRHRAGSTCATTAPWRGWRRPSRRVDVLFNCAGYVHGGTVLDCTDADWDLAFDLNVRSMFRTIRAWLPGMLERGKGSIVNMASAASSVKGAANRFVYGTTKAAVIGLTKSIAADYVGRGIRCNAICPATVDTPSLRQRIASAGDPEPRTAPSSRASRWAASPPPRRSRRWCSTSRRTNPASPPASPTSSTAAGRTEAGPMPLNFLSLLTGSFAYPAAENPTVAMVEAAYRHHGLDCALHQLRGAAREARRRRARRPGDGLGGVQLLAAAQGRRDRASRRARRSRPRSWARSTASSAAASSSSARTPTARASCSRCGGSIDPRGQDGGHVRRRRRGPRHRRRDSRWPAPARSPSSTASRERGETLVELLNEKTPAQARASSRWAGDLPRPGGDRHRRQRHLDRPLSRRRRPARPRPRLAAARAWSSPTSSPTRRAPA